MKRCLLAILLQILLSYSVSAANKLPFEVFYDFVQLYLEISDDFSENPEELHSNLSKYYENPIDWNKATHEQLSDLLFLPDHLIDELLYYIYIYGPVHSINELRLVPYVDDKLFDLLPSVLTVSDSIQLPHWSDPFPYSSHKFTSRTDFEAERRQGYKTGAYPGPPFRQLLKYNTEASPSFSAAVTLETDAGEPWNVRGFDLYRAYAQFSSFLNDSRVVVGTYCASFGCGLIIGASSYGNFPSRLRAKRSSYSIRGYSGTSEAPSLNGVAASIVPVKGLNLTAVYGYSPLQSPLFLRRCYCLRRFFLPPFHDFRQKAMGCFPRLFRQISCLLFFRRDFPLSAQCHCHNQFPHSHPSSRTLFCPQHTSFL